MSNVKIKRADGGPGYRIIAREQFDPKAHELFHPSAEPELAKLSAAAKQPPPKKSKKEAE